MEEEIWKDIEGYEGLYQVSNLGRVKSLYRRKERILIASQSNGYYQVTLVLNKVKNIKYVHRLVAETFIPNPNNLPQVGHKDETKSNNRVDNLEWVTNKENSNMPLHKYRLSKSSIGKIISEETKSKMSLAHRGENNSMYGKHLSKEAKEKISEKNRGKQLSAETKEKISKALSGKLNPFYGKHHTEETKAKISIAKTGGKGSKAKPVECEGIWFSCIKDCANYYSINSVTMAQWLNGRRKMPEKFIKLGLKYSLIKEKENSNG